MDAIKNLIRIYIVLLFIFSCKKEVSLPNNLDEAIKILEPLIDVKVKQYLENNHTFTKDEIGDINHKLISEIPYLIRSKWLNNNECNLSKWFHEKGIGHPDDQVSLVIKCLKAKLGKTHFNLDEEIKFILDSWKMKTIPKLYVNQNPFMLVVPIEYNIPDVANRTILHLGFDYQTKDIWFYEFKLGWLKPTTDLLNKFELQQKIDENKDFKDLIERALKNHFQ